MAGTVVDAARVGERMLGPGVLVMGGPPSDLGSGTHTHSQLAFQNPPGEGPDRDA